MTITEKYNFKILKNQGHEEVWEYYQDESEIDLIESFEKNTLELKKDNSPYVMIEVGSNQAYYSLLFKHILGKENTTNIMIEPYVPYLELGKKHFDINNCEGIFYNNGIGNDWVIQTNQSIKNFQTEPITLYKIFENHQLTKIDVLHFDIDGSETKLLNENEKLFLNKKIKHVYILTHSDALHDECKQFFTNLEYSLYLDIPFHKRQVGSDGLLIYKLNE